MPEIPKFRLPEFKRPTIPEPVKGKMKEWIDSGREWTKSGIAWLKSMKSKLDTHPREVITAVADVPQHKGDFIAIIPVQPSDTKRYPSEKDVTPVIASEELKEQAVIPEFCKANVMTLLSKALPRQDFTVVGVEETKTGGGHTKKITIDVDGKQISYYYKDNNYSLYVQQLSNELGKIVGIQLPRIWGIPGETTTSRIPKITSGGTVTFDFEGYHNNSQCVLVEGVNNGTNLSQIKAIELTVDQAKSLGRLTAFTRLFGLSDTKIDHTFLLSNGQFTRIDNSTLFDFYDVQGEITRLNPDAQGDKATALFRSWLNETTSQSFTDGETELYRTAFENRDKLFALLQNNIGVAADLNLSVLKVVEDNILKRCGKSVENNTG